MPTIQYHHQTIAYTLTRNAKRNINFRVKNDGEICISAPKRVGEQEIKKLVREKADWLLQNQEKNLKKKQNMIPEQITTGSTLYLNGRKYWVKVSSGPENHIYFRENVLMLQVKEAYADSQEYIDNYFQKWLRDSTYALSNEMIDRYLLALKKYHLKRPSLSIRAMTSRWGSCQPTKGKITINRNLLFPPHQCLEYVVLHELAHLVVPNHSPHFYAVIEYVMPDWEKRRKMLNEF